MGLRISIASQIAKLDKVELGRNARMSDKRNKHKTLLIIIGLIAFAINMVSNACHIYQRDLALYFFEQRDSYGFVAQSTVAAMDRLTEIVDTASIFAWLLLSVLFFTWIRDFSRAQISGYFGYAAGYIALSIYFYFVILPAHGMGGNILRQLLIGVFLFPYLTYITFGLLARLIINTIPHPEDLLKAAAEGDVRRINQALLHGFDVNYISPTGDGDTALIYAASSGHLNAVRKLLDRGADVRIVNKHGFSADHIAELAGKEDVVELIRNSRQTLSTNTEIEPSQTWELQTWELTVPDSIIYIIIGLFLAGVLALGHMT